MDEARVSKRSRWVFRLGGVGLLALILVLAARSPGSAGKAVTVAGAPASRAAGTCAAEDAQEMAAQRAAATAAHNEDLQENRNPLSSSAARAEDLAEHDAFVQAHQRETAEDEAEATGYGACTDSTADIALPAP